MRRGREVYGFVTDVGEFGGDGWYGDPSWATQERADGFVARVADDVGAAGSARSSPLRRGDDRRRRRDS